MTVVTPTAAAAAVTRPLVVDNPGLLPTERAAARLSRAVLLRRGFTLLAGCLSDGGGDGDQRDEMAALVVREGLWSRRSHLVVIYSLLWPWAGGLLPRAADGDEVEQCERLVMPGWTQTDQVWGYCCRMVERYNLYFVHRKISRQTK